MTNDEINITIAEHCGWKHIVYDKYFGAFGEPPSHEVDDAPVPDYCNNLNAMHDAEMTLTDFEYHRFTRIINDICWRRFPDQIKVEDYNNRLRCSFSGPAKVRAEAFIKAINKWHD